MEAPGLAQERLPQVLPQHEEHSQSPFHHGLHWYILYMYGTYNEHTCHTYTHVIIQFMHNYICSTLYICASLDLVLCKQFEFGTCIDYSKFQLMDILVSDVFVFEVPIVHMVCT